MLEGRNSNKRYNLVRLEPKRLFGELKSVHYCFLKSLHDLIILCLVTTQKVFHHLVPNARTHAHFIQSMILICITHIQDEVVQLPPPKPNCRVSHIILCLSLTPSSLVQPMLFVNPHYPHLAQIRTIHTLVLKAQ